MTEKMTRRGFLTASLAALVVLVPIPIWAHHKPEHNRSNQDDRGEPDDPAGNYTYTKGSNLVVGSLERGRRPRH